MRDSAFSLSVVSCLSDGLLQEAGHVLDEEHWHTHAELGEANQCLKSWFDQDMVPDDINVSTLKAINEYDITHDCGNA